MEKNLKLTSRGRYAVTAMITLARAQKNKPLPLSKIAETSNISLSYLEQLITGLKQYGLVKSYRGPGGGYILARPSSEIVVSEILEAAEDTAPAKKGSGKSEKNMCTQTYELWNYIGKVLHANLELVSLDDVLKGHIQGKNLGIFG